MAPQETAVVIGDVEPLTPGDRVRAEVFGSVWTVAEARRAIEGGLPTSSLTSLLSDRVEPNKRRSSVLESLNITERTLERRKKAGRLNSSESDRLFRLVNLLALAADVLGDVADAREWMSTPKLALGNETPIDYARNEAGARSVEDLLKRIEYGVYG